ncbi:MAG: hypothetical protein KF809_15065 [Chloroflexi bacterium]|nr:hypothetical protein [Chloroflexota bacterium]
MDQDAIRRHLELARSELEQLDRERDALLAMVHADEELLRLRGASQGSLGLVDDEPVVTPPPTSTVKGPSFRGTLLRVIQDAHGAPLHETEILRRVRAAGADTKGRDPLSVTDLMCYSLAKRYPIVKVAARTWRWVGEDAEAER